MPSKKPLRPIPKAVIKRLEADALIRFSGDEWQTTKRWQGAMMRAALTLMHQGDPGDDIRVPITHALLQIYGNDIVEADLFDRVVAMIKIEAHSLGVRRVVMDKNQTDTARSETNLH